MGTERALGHLLVIENSIERLFQAIDPFLLFIGGSQFGIPENLNGLVDTRAHELERRARAAVTKARHKITATMKISTWRTLECMGPTLSAGSGTPAGAIAQAFSWTITKPNRRAKRVPRNIADF